MARLPETTEESQQRLKAEKAFYICAIVFSAAAACLILLSMALPAIKIWLLLPLPVFAMIIGILSIVAFGVPSTRSQLLVHEVKEDVTPNEKEDLTKQKGDEKLELKELETLATKHKKV